MAAAGNKIVYSVMLFWVKSPRGLVGRIRRFGEVSCLHLHPNPRGDLTEKNIIGIDTAVKKLNLTK
jgi:hypothetical protein